MTGAVLYDDLVWTASGGGWWTTYVDGQWVSRTWDEIQPCVRLDGENVR